MEHTLNRHLATLRYCDAVNPLAVTVQGAITIAAVLVGALGTFLATERVERTRWTREHATRWDERKLQVYTEYAASVKMAIIRSRSILGGLGLSPTLTPISREEGLPLLALDENSRSEKLESVMRSAVLKSFPPLGPGTEFPGPFITGRAA